ncbi:MAG: cell division protein ZapA [Elusimicrobiota bacterium]|nr:cell division protein ZapA [Elusimicrobiota bacterium]
MKIMGVTLLLEVDDSLPSDLQSVEKYVEDMCQRLKEQNNIADTAKISMLCAVTIADELFKLKALQQTTCDDYKRKLNKLIKQMDEANLNS